MVILAQDTFATRSVSGSWGTASDGNTWVKLHGGGTVLSVGSNEGKVHGGITDGQMLLGSGTATDQEGLVRLALGQSGDSIGLVLRCDATGANYYYSEIGNFTNDITIYKVVSGTKTNLNIFASGITISNGSFCWIRFQVVGTTLKCRIWADGATEPATWTGSVTDSALASGQYGLFFNSFGTVDAQFDSYQANDAGGGGGGGGGVSPLASIIPAMPLISQGVPAYTNDDSSGSFPASNANNSNYHDNWRCAAAPSGNANSGTLTQSPAFTTPFPVYLAYDLSSVPALQRGQVGVAWYDDTPGSGPYDPGLVANNYYNVANAYTIDVNAASAGTLPTSGWVTKVTVTGNTYHSRQHSFDMTGFNWVRINVTASIGSASNNNVAMDMDIHDAHLGGVGDSWIFYGDSITMAGFNHDDSGGLGDIIPAQVHVLRTNYPIWEGAGIGGWRAIDAQPYVGSTFLPLFPGKYVALNYGTNDANGGGSLLTSFSPTMQSMITSILAAGKIPIIPHIPWGSAAGIATNGSTINADIDALVAANPGTLAGPDLWTYFSNNQMLISGDGIHPTSPAGYAAYRTQWANWAVTNVYLAFTTNPPSVPVGISSSFSLSSYSGKSPIPLVLPSFFPRSSWYAVGGTILPDQPSICTAPLPQGNSIQVGSTFILLFQLPSLTTQTTLTNGAIVQMTFPLFGGAIVTGEVQLASTLTGSVFQVICTVVSSSISLSSSSSS